MRYVSLMLLCVAFATAARAAEWQPPVRLNPDAEGWFPDVTADLAGHAHVVWSSGPGPDSGDLVLYCSPTQEGCGKVETLARRPVRSGVYVTRPVAVVDQHAVFHLLWRQKMLLVYTAKPLQTLLAPDEWSRPRKLGDGSYTALALDHRGSLHAAWSQPIFVHWGGPCDGDIPCYGCADIHYSRSDDGGHAWTLPVNVSRTMTGSEKPHIAVDTDGTVYIAWEEGRDHYVGAGQRQSSMLSVSSDGGRSWHNPVSFTDPNDTPHSIALGLDGRGHVVVVWQQVTGTGIYFQTSSDRGHSWTSPRQIAGVHRRRLDNKLDDYDMAADSRGHLHLVLTGGLAEVMAQQQVLHLEWDGQEWSAPAPLFRTDGAPEWPRIAVGNGNQLHAVWFERPAGFEWKPQGKNYAIWYAQGRSAAPFIAPAAWPEPTPRRMTTGEWLRLAQAVLAVMTVAAVVVATRRLGW